MDIFEALREDHDRHRTLLDLVDRTEGDSDGRRELFGRLKAELQAHAAAEEMTFYASLIAAEQTVEQARHSVAEHHEADELLEQLDGMDFSSSNWLTVFRKLKDAVEHHMTEEEQEVFVMAGRVIADADKETMAREFRSAKEEQLESAAG